MCFVCQVLSRRDTKPGCRDAETRREEVFDIRRLQIALMLFDSTWRSGLPVEIRRMGSWKVRPMPFGKFICGQLFDRAEEMVERRLD